MMQLVALTDGYSGSDVSILMKKVHYMGVEEFEQTNHFIQVGLTKDN